MGSIFPEVKPKRFFTCCNAFANGIYANYRKHDFDYCASLFNREIFCSCRNTQSVIMFRFRCPLTTAPVRTEGFFCACTVVILHTGKPRPREPLRRLPKLSTEIFRRGFLFSSENSSLCEAVVAPESRPFFSYLWISTENRQT